MASLVETVCVGRVIVGILLMASLVETVCVGRISVGILLMESDADIDDRSDSNNDDDTGISGVPASDGSAEDAGARDGDAETTGATEARTANACDAVYLSTGNICMYVCM